MADLLRGDYKQSDYGKVILPFTVLRRLDCVLEPTKTELLEEKTVREGQGLDPVPFLLRKAGQNFCNSSPLDMKRLLGDQDNIGENLRSYISAFTPEVRDIFESFEFHLQVDRLEKAGLLYMVCERFAQIDLHPETVSNAEMGLVFEELIRKFAELSNETAGEHFTPREVIRLMVNLIFIEDDQALTQPGIVRSLYDPTAGTGGMLSVAEEHLVEMNPSARLVLSGQELNPESHAICKADMLIKGQDIKNIRFGNTLSDDQLGDQKYDYMLSNPPFGVEWKKIQKEVQREADTLGFAGHFGPGLPRVSDGSLLFLLHLISKMRPEKAGGSRFGIVLELAARRAGRLMLEEIDRCGAAGMDFAFETTLAGKAYLQRIHLWQADGYRVKLIFLKLSHEEAAIRRVAERVAQGGHSIPPDVIRRRFVSGLRNFTTLYQPIVDAWQLIDNGGTTPHLITQGGRS